MIKEMFSVDDILLIELQVGNGQLLWSKTTLHIDATYRLNWQGYPVIIVGVSSATGKFFGSLSVLSSHEDSEAWNEI